jgi:hypothetical protein
MFLSFVCFSQTPEILSVDISRLDPATAEKMRNLNDENLIEKKIQRYGKWVGLGKEVGTAAREGLSALSDESNKFAETKVGKYVMFIIAFKILGYPITQLIVGLLIFFIGTTIFVIYFLREGISKRYITKETVKDGVTEKVYGMTNTGSNALYSFLLYVALVLICIAIIFIH